MRHAITGLLLVLLLPVVVATSPVGFEFVDDGDYLHTWNGNPDGADRANIWQDAASGYSQFFNGFDLDDAKGRAQWLTHRFGLAYYNAGGHFTYFSESVLDDYNLSVQSDNLTFWNQSVVNCDFGPCFGWLRGQERFDRYMENSFFVSSDRAFSFHNALWYVWEFDDVQIENDTVVDEVFYCFLDGGVESCDTFFLDSTEEFEVDGVTQIFIRDSVSKRGHFVFGEDVLRLRYEGDGDVLVMAAMNDGVAPSGWSGTEVVRMWWIDAALAGEVTVDYTGQRSGYIKKVSTGFSYYYEAYYNTNALVGRNVSGSGVEKRGFFTFNLSSLPEDANVTNVSIFLDVVTVADSQPSEWRDRFFSGCNEVVEDGNGLNAGPGTSAGDWDDGHNTGASVIWEDACGYNYPCDAWVVLADDLSDSAALNATRSVRENLSYFIAMRDDSLYEAGQIWEASYGVTSKGKVLLKVWYTYGVTDEAEARVAIVEGILSTGYDLFIYNDTVVDTVMADGVMSNGRFDRVAYSPSSQAWAFNYLTAGDAFTFMSPLYNWSFFWENYSLYYDDIVEQADSFIESTPRMGRLTDCVDVGAEWDCDEICSGFGLTCVEGCYDFDYGSVLTAGIYYFYDNCAESPSGPVAITTCNEEFPVGYDEAVKCCCT
ncbi:MAG: hypothetical protein V1735_02990 [Nanoarchaeota archaeon]